MSVSTVAAMPRTTKDGRPLYKFRVIEGEHQGKHRKYSKGESFLCPDELDLMFHGKFQREPLDIGNIPIDGEDGPDKNKVPPGLEEHVHKTPSGTPKDMMPFDFASAANVSRNFPLAKDAKVDVYKDSLGAYAVAEANALVKTNLAGGPLGSKKAVNQFLAEISPPESETEDGEY